jgi:hypothetical protein
MKKPDTLERIHALKTTIVALLALGIGVALLALARAIADNAGWDWLSFWPLGELGSILVGAGLLGIVWDYFDSKDKEARDTERLRRVLAEAAPDLRDAVVEGFAVNSDDLKRVATPELLDSIASNALGLRLSDNEFAREIYAELVENVIGAPERWHDVDVRIRLSSTAESTANGGALREVPFFAITVTWEYSVIPSSPVQRFACTSSREEFHDLISDIPSTSTWFMTSRPGFVASERDSFELLQYSVDGEERSIRRSARKAGQTYSVRVGDDIVRDGRMARVRHTYRTITPTYGHLLMIAIAQPAKGLTLTLDYTDAEGVAAMRVSDLVSSAQRPRLSRLPDTAEAREISLDVPGWILPQAEVSFVWTLSDEMQKADAVAALLDRAG